MIGRVAAPGAARRRTTSSSNTSDIVPFDLIMSESDDLDDDQSLAILRPITLRNAILALVDLPATAPYLIDLKTQDSHEALSQQPVHHHRGAASDFGKHSECMNSGLRLTSDCIGKT